MTKKQKKKTAANVVPFVPVAATERLDAPEDDLDEAFADVKPSHAEIVEMLAEMDDVEYDRCRHRKHIEWGIQLSTLDRMRQQAKRVRAYKEKQQPPPVDEDELVQRLRPIIEREGILDLWIEAWDKVMAGEHRNAKLLYLIATSRLFDNCMHVAIKGPSSGGKSGIRKQVLEFFPQEDIINFDTLSEKALIYDERDYPHKILSMAEAIDAESQELQNMMLRQLMSEGRLDHLTVQRVHGVHVSIRIEKHGPVCFMVTTTKATLHPENETRMISIEIDDSEEQTRRVLKKQARTHGRNIKPDDSIYLDWQDFQRLLRIVGNKNVDVPFADALAALIPPKAVRLRRDYPQILACIKAHALIHRYRREIDDKDQIVADLELDYVPVAELLGPVASEGAGIAVSDDLLETIEAVKLATVGIPNNDGATAYEVGKKLNLDKSAARRRLLVAMDKGFVVNLEQRPFQRGKYRLTEQEIEAESLLPSVEEIRDHEDLSSGEPPENDATAPPDGKR